MSTNSMSNWGRWGDADQRGTLNLLTAEHVVAAARLVKQGKVYSLAIPLDPKGPIAPSRNSLWHRTTVTARPAPAMSSVDDVIVMHTHGTTHVDALCHVFYDNQMYNGYPVDRSIAPTTGAAKNGVQNISSIVGRGVLLDVAGFRGVAHLGQHDAIAPEELDACAASEGVEIRQGDIVLIRTGWLSVFGVDPALYDSGSPGPSGAVAGWFKQHDLVAIGADNTAVEPYPPPHDEPLRLHLDVIRNLGGYLLELVNLDDLARDRAYEFLFVAAPLRLVNGIGSPLNPLAIV